MSIISPSVLFGRDPHRTRQFLIVATVFFASNIVDSADMIRSTPSTGEVILGPVVIALVVTMVNAYLNDGLLVSILIAVVFEFGGALAMNIRSGLTPVLKSSPPSTMSLGVPLLTVVFFSGIGIGASVMGAGIRRVATHVW